MNKLSLRLTPMVRWMMTFASHAERFKGVYSPEVVKQLAERYKTAEDRVRSMAISVIRIDLLLLLTLYSAKLMNVKIFGQNVSDLAFLSEFLLVASAISFFYLVVAFTTSRSYESMVGALADLHQPRSGGWNGHFYKAAIVDQELALHVASQRLHTHPAAQDDWIGGKKMKRLENSFRLMVLATTTPLLLLHLGVTIWSVIVLPQRAALGFWIDGILVTFAVGMNLVGVAIFCFIHLRQQDFEHSEIRADQ
jgi:hypothetical protein